MAEHQHQCATNYFAHAKCDCAAPQAPSGQQAEPTDAQTPLDAAIQHCEAHGINLEFEVLDGIVAAALAGQQSERPAADTVPVPQNEDQAAMMALLGEHWLRVHAPHRLRPAPAGQAVGEPEQETCPRCDGQGHVMVLSDNGPDAYEVPETCPHCEGNQTLSAAYEGVLKLLAQSEDKKQKTYAIVWRRGLGDGDALTRMRDIAEVLPANALWARDRLLELAASYEALAASQAERPPAGEAKLRERIEALLDLFDENNGPIWSGAVLVEKARAALSAEQKGGDRG